MNEILDFDAQTLARLIRQRELSALEVTNASLEQMQQFEPTLHAFCTPTAELARSQAQTIDKQLANGESVGPLAGVPMAIKDLINTAGVKTTSGSFVYEHFVPDEDDIVVERVRRAGAVILGKTTAPEFGYSGVGHNPLFESPRNPWDITKTPGGSSDGGGSVRIPAAHCGVYGLKASMGRVPLYPGCRDERYPGVSSWESLEHIGPMTRTVGDAALMMSVISGPDARDRHSIPAGDVDWLGAVKRDIKGLRVAVSADWGYAAVDPEVREVFLKAVSVFERELGCTVEFAHPGFKDPRQAFMALVAMDTDLVGMRRLLPEFGDKMSPHLVDMLTRQWTAEDFTNAITERKAVTNTMWRFMQRYDLLLTPTLAVAPFPLYMQGPEVIEGRMVANNEWLSLCFPMNLTGQPAASVPAGFTESGLPVGLQLVGGHLDDATVLAASAAFEQAQPWNHRKPGVLSR
jgi:aspartyl-tRNA(Asn)/glutamyl-tRNA(Gln) amidotransferase subunit A